MDIEAYLNCYERIDGEWYVESDGTIHRKENPKLVETLKLKGKKSLYIEEVRIYENPVCLLWQNRYKNI